MSAESSPAGLEPPGHAKGRFNLRTLGKLLVLAVLMFGFGFAMVPLYRTICEVTGINLLTRQDPAAVAAARTTVIDTSRTVRVEFDANQRGPWRFKPAQGSVKVRPGELVTVEYELLNTLATPLTGQAIPSYAPGAAGRFFRKLECFCFAQQALQGYETRRFPVVFMIDPALPADITEITLSYTFFDLGAAGAAPVSGQGS